MVWIFECMLNPRQSNVCPIAALVVEIKVFGGIR
jgi:hypothetical protein